MSKRHRDLTMPRRQRRHHGWTWVRSLRHQETKPPGPSKIRTRARKGDQTKGVSLSLDLSGKTRTMTSSSGVEKFYLVVEGRVLSLDLTLHQAGISWDVSVRMCFRLHGGVRHEVPGLLDMHGLQHGRVLACSAELLQMWGCSWFRAICPFWS